VANYIKATNFSVKDTLNTGDPAKIIKGTEIDTEFTNIAAAVSSKADSESPTFTGTPVAPTASLGTNTTQLATTAFVLANQTALASVYPIGSIYINATNSTNPGTLLGFGTWVAFGAGRVLVGFNASDPLFDSAEETGGSKNAIVVSHTHTGTTSTAGTHSHTYTESFGGPGASAAVSGVSGPDTKNTSSAGAHSHTFTTDSTGSSGTNANLQPYITVYMWKRTA